MDREPTTGLPRGDGPREPIAGAPVALGDRVLDGRSVCKILIGGQAWVLVLDEPESGRRVVKVPRSGSVGDIELAAMLRLAPHARVVTVLDVADVRGRRGIVMEYMPNTLLDLIRSRHRSASAGDARMPPPRTARIMQEVCAGMSHLSETGEFAHLDLKPSNVLVDEDHHVKIADFGLAQRVRDREGRFSSAGGGTWAYAAPEVLRDQNCDSRADVFSFGVMLYEYETGELPYPFPLATDPREQHAQLLKYYDSTGPRERANELYYRPTRPTSVPVLPGDEGISHLVDGCLQANMAERPYSFRHLAEMIKWRLREPVDLCEPVRLAEIDRQRRELTLAQVLVAADHSAEAVRRLNRLLTTSLPDGLGSEVLATARAALRAAGREECLPLLAGWA